MDSGDVPPLFTCPISLEIMKDPVTISTGMTFDRGSIHKWLSQYNQNTCPVTKQTLPHQFLTPNSNLLRLIQSWTLIHNQKVVSGTKLESKNHQNNPVSDHQVQLFQLMQALKQSAASSQRKCILRKIKLLIIQGNDEHGIHDHQVNFDLASLVASIIMEDDQNIEAISDGDQNWEIIEEAVPILDCIKLTGEELKKLAQHRDGKMVALLSSVVVQQERSYQARIQAVFLLISVFRVVEDIYKAELKMDLFEGIAEILKDQNSVRGSMGVLSILIQVLPYGSSRKKAVEAGIVPILIELLSETNEKRICEVLLHVLNQICKGAEGRASFLDHPAAVPTVSSKILRISQVANDRAVALLSCLFRFCETNGVAKELLEVGGAAKMCMVLQTHCSPKTKDRAKAILGFYHRLSIDYSCLPSRFIP